MNLKETESATSPDGLAKSRGEALHRRADEGAEESAWRGTFEQTEFPTGDESLKLSRFLAIASLAIIAATLMYPAVFTIVAVGWGTLLLYCLNMVCHERQKRAVIDSSIIGNYLPLPKSTTLWGVIIPLAVTVSLYLILPASAVTETSAIRWLFLSVVSSFCCAIVAHSLDKEITRPKFIGFLNGITFGTALSAFMLFTTLIVAGVHLHDYWIVIPVIGLLLTYSSGLMTKLLLRIDRKISIPVFGMACVGALISFTAGIAPELRGLAIAFGEKLVATSEPKCVDVGYRILNDLNAAPELAIASGQDQFGRSLSLAASFIPVDKPDGERMYFHITGKAHNHNETQAKINNFQNVNAAVPNQKVHGLTLVDSKMSGFVDANSLTSVTYWTMVFGNSSDAQQEAQAKICLPPNSAVSRVTLWVNGKPEEAAFNSTGRVMQAYQWITERHRDPLLITETAPGIINLQAFPVPKFGEMKVRIGITSGLAAKSKRDFSFIAPQIVSSNFELEDAKTFVKLESNAPISSNAEDGRSVSKNEKVIYTAQIVPDERKNYQFVAHRATDFTGFTAKATHSKEDMIISEKLVTSAVALSKIAVVIDGSNAVGSERDEIKRALTNIPKSTQAKIFLADHREDVDALSVDEAIARLSEIQYSGGVNDTKALIAARKYIGRNSHAAIIWIHGPQPIVFDQDKDALRRLMISGEHRLKIYDFQMSSDDRDNEIKNYLAKLDINACPDFRPIEQLGSVESDLSNLFKHSVGGNAEYSVSREKTANTHSAATSYDSPVASRLSTVWAADEARRCASVGLMDTAVLLGTAYRVVTPATGAVVMELQSDYEHQDLHRNFDSVVSANSNASAQFAGGDDSRSSSSVRASRHAKNSANALVPPPPVSTDAFASRTAPPSLQGATVGTIGPQGSDFVSSIGVNTAGTVRVNPLGNLEAVLNFIVLGLEGLCVVYGAVSLFQGFFIRSARTSAAKKLLLGSVLLFVGLSIPGVFNYLWASAVELGWFS